MTLKNNDFPLSNIDINKMIEQLDKNGANIISSNEIYKMNTIDELFKNRGHVIIHYVYDNNPQNAHWVCLVRNINNGPKYIYFFDSFGDNNILNRDTKLKNHLIYLCKKSNYKFIANNQKIQSNKSMTCGRYCLLVYALNKINTDPEQIEHIIKKIKEPHLIKLIS